MAGRERIEHQQLWSTRMSFVETIKGLTLKKPSADQRHSTKAMADGQGENENPYLAARRTWNDRTSSIVSSRNMWQLLGIQ